MEKLEMKHGSISLIAAALILATLAGCVSEANAPDFTPAPQDEEDGIHSPMANRFRGMGDSLANAGDQLKYHFFNTNSSLPPYDTWCDDQLPRDMATIQYTLDSYFFEYDWKQDDLDVDPLDY